MPWTALAHLRRADRRNRRTHGPTAGENPGRPAWPARRRSPLRRCLPAALRQRRQHLSDPAAGRGALRAPRPMSAACVQYAAENQIPFTPAAPAPAWPANRSGRDWCSISPSYMRRILGTDGETRPRAARRGPSNGSTRYLRPLGPQFGPDPAMSNVTTMGSVIAIDASGSHWLQLRLGPPTRGQPAGRAGRRRRSWKSADEPVPATAGHRRRRRPDRRQDLDSRLAELIVAKRELIDQHQPKSLVNRCGYHLHDVLHDGHARPGRLLVGSKGRWP